MATLENMVSGASKLLKKGIVGLAMLATLANPLYANDYANGEFRYKFNTPKARLVQTWESKPLPGIDYSMDCTLFDKVKQISKCGITAKSDAKYSEQLELQNPVNKIILVYTIYNRPSNPESQWVAPPEIQVKTRSGYTQIRTKDSPVEDYQTGNIHVVRLENGLISDSVKAELKKTDTFCMEERKTLDSYIRKVGGGDSTLPNGGKINPDYKVLVYYFLGKGIEGVKATRIGTKLPMAGTAKWICGEYLIKCIDGTNDKFYSGCLEK